MKDIEEGSPHGTLTVNTLLILCLVGIIMWLGIIQCGMMLWEIV